MSFRVMGQRWRVVPTLAVILLPLFQAPLPSPPAVGGGRSGGLPPVGVEEKYGPLEVVDLERLAHSGRTYHRRLVQVRGVLGVLVPGRYLDLREGAAGVMLIPFEGGDYDAYATLIGMDVDVTGVARVLPAKQETVPCRGSVLLESQCEDGDLPPLPAAQPGWPSVSITVTKLMDHGTDSAPRPRGPVTPANGGVVGQFRGANLCRDLPMATRRDPADWVLLTAEGPVWVTGHRPEGQGFRLDPASRGDTSRWLAVSGKVQIVDGVRYLKAGKIVMASRPEQGPTYCPP